jgi:hypothetical protein
MGIDYIIYRTICGWLYKKALKRLEETCETMTMSRLAQPGGVDSSRTPMKFSNAQKSLKNGGLKYEQAKLPRLL